MRQGVVQAGVAVLNMIRSFANDTRRAARGPIMRRFVLGLGAQKAGTTWLFSQFDKMENFRAPGQKEMHIFDRIHLPALRGKRKVFEKKTIQRIEKGFDAYKDDFAIKRFHMMCDTEAYYSYFDKLLDADGTFTADITPTYATLSQEVLREIKEAFIARGIDIKVVFLMREPVTRIESAIRMKLRRQNRTHKITDHKIAQLLKKEIGGMFDVSRGAYEETVTNIDAVFDQEDVYYGFYETMFSEGEIARLCGFFDLDIGKFDVNQRVNSTSATYQYPPDVIDAAIEHYADHYAFARDRFGFDTDRWRQKAQKLSAA